MALLALSVVSACGGTDWDGRWRDAQGRLVPAQRVGTAVGSAHCDWEDVVFLTIGADLAGRLEIGRLYNRDPSGTLREYTVGAYTKNAALPPGAIATGLRNDDDARLWVRPGFRNAVYIVVDGRVERWPRAMNAPGCA